MSVNNNTKRNIFNRQIWIYSQLIHKGCNSGIAYGGEALRLWFLAKDWDIAGNGRIVESEFKEYLINHLKLKNYNIQRWLSSELGQAHHFAVYQ